MWFAFTETFKHTCPCHSDHKIFTVNVSAFCDFDDEPILIMMSVSVLCRNLRRWITHKAAKVDTGVPDAAAAAAAAQQSQPLQQVIFR